MVDQDRPALLRSLRDAVRGTALPGFGRLLPGDISRKSNAEDLVTEMDLAVEAIVTQDVAQILPDALMVGEEGVAADPSLMEQIAGAEMSVILDPIDGTWNYAHMIPLWGAILAVCKKGKPVLGAIYDPMTDHMLGAMKGQGLFAEREGAAVAVDRHQTAVRSGFLQLQLLPPEVREAAAAAGARLGRTAALRCAAQEYRALARGTADWVLSGVIKPWDHVAGTLMVEEAGGVARLLDGGAYDATVHEGCLLSARDEATWEAVAAEMRPILL